MDDWPEYPLGSFVDPKRSICYGIVQPGKPRERGVPIVRVNNFKEGRIDTRDALTINPEIEGKYQRSRLQGGELLLTLVGTMGLSAIVPNELRGWNVARAVGVVPLKENVDKRWLNFVLRSQPSQDFIQTHANTTVQATFNLRDLARLPIPMPPDDVRLPASELLSALDDKIELNRRMNETLEAMARAIFKDWFVDFGPIRAKAEGSDPYLAPELWDLFPDALGDEDKPCGWPVQGLDEFVSLTKGRSYKSAELKDSDVALVTLKSFERGGGYRRDGLKPYSGKYKPEQVVEPGELVVALTDVTQAADVIGKPAIVLEDDWYGTLVASLDVGIVRLRGSRVGLSFISQLLRTEQFQNHVYSHCTGTTVLHLSKDFLPTFKACIPPVELAAWFEDTVAPISVRVAANAREGRTLAQTRDLLLPKLMSGEIRLREAEKAVEAVA